MYLPSIYPTGILILMSCPPYFVLLEGTQWHHRHLLWSVRIALGNVEPPELDDLLLVKYLQTSHCLEGVAELVLIA